MKEKIPLTEEEKSQLTFEVNKFKSNLPFGFLGILIFVTFLIFIPGKNHSPSIYFRYGYLKPFLLTFLIYIIFSLFEYYKIKKDLKSNQKILDKTFVYKKERQFTKGKFLIFIDIEISKFNKFEISKEDYDQISEDDEVILEYAEKSKILFKLVNLKIDHEIKPL
jgi:hypothetical protein